MKKEKKPKKIHSTDDSTKLMASFLSNVVNNLAEEFHKIKFKCGHNHQKNQKLYESRDTPLEIC